MLKLMQRGSFLLIIAVLAAAADARDKEPRAPAAKASTDKAFAKTKKEFQQRIRNKNPSERIAALKLLEDHPTPEAADLVYVTMLDDRASEVRSAAVDFLTVGQYLQPTRKHHPVVRFVAPDEFKAYETTAYAKGFLLVSATPLTRSSHHAGEDFAKLKAAREAAAR